MREFSSDTSKIYVRLLGFVRPHWKVFALSIVAMIGLASTEWILPALVKPLIDGNFDDGQDTLAFYIPLVLITLFFVRGVLSYVATVSLNWVAQTTICDLRVGMFDTLIRLPSSFYDKSGTGYLISKFTFDVTQVAEASTRVITVAVKDSAVILVLLGYLTYLNWRLAVFLIFFAPLIAILVGRVSKKMRNMSSRLQDAIGELNGVAGEAIKGHREIKIYNGYSHEGNQFSHAVHHARKFQMKVVRTSAMVVPLIQLIVATGISILIMFALKEATDSAMTRGDFVSFVTATALLLPPIKRLAGANEFLQRGVAAARSVFTLMDTPVEKNEGLALGKVQGRVEFVNISASYDGQEVLSKVSLAILPGETVAFVGKSGGGKSTLVNLVPRFYTPSSGVIKIDGVDIETFTLDGLRANIGHVSQNIVLFNDTIYNNIAYGTNCTASEKQVLYAAEKAQVLAFSNQFSDGMQTVIGENGSRLSGGQKQRIAIARAFLKDAPILIMDEATAALDNEAENLIQEALKVLRNGRTNLVVAHRLSTVIEADRIVVIDKGVILEVGTHDELLSNSGVYSRLYSTHFEFDG
jgi:ATP-binding cassette, subfamily B, bacterial MsbA